MSLENIHVEIATEYMKTKRFLEKVGFEVVGVNPQKSGDIYRIRKKKRSRSQTSGH